MQKCLEKAGLEVVTSGDLPIIEGSKALGVRVKGRRGKIMPGHLLAAIFWYDSDAKVNRFVSRNPGGYPVVTTRSEGTIVVGYDPAPSAGLHSAVNSCTEGLAS